MSGSERVSVATGSSSRSYASRRCRRSLGLFARRHLAAAAAAAVASHLSLYPPDILALDIVTETERRSADQLGG